MTEAKPPVPPAPDEAPATKREARPGFTATDALAGLFTVRYPMAPDPAPDEPDENPAP
jgi:hypothetical protein